MPSVARALLVVSVLLASPIRVAAHDVAKGPNGGPIVTVADHHLELTETAGTLAIFMTDAKHEPIAAAGASGRAIVQSGGKTTTVALAPGAGNRLDGKSEVPVEKGARVVVTVTLDKGANVQARFVLP